MMARQPDSGLDEITRVPERRPVLYSGAREAPRRRLKQLRSAFRIETTPTAGELTDPLPGDAPVAVLGNAPLAAFAGAAVGCLATEHFSTFGIVPAIASALATALVCGLLLVTRTTGLFAGAFFSALWP